MRSEAIARGWGYDTLSLLLSGFSLLVHGFGSKKDVLEAAQALRRARAGPRASRRRSASAKPFEPRPLQLLLQKLRVPAQGSSAAALCAQVRRAFEAEERERAAEEREPGAPRDRPKRARAPRAEAADDAATDDADDDGDDDGAADDGAAADAARRAPPGSGARRRRRR